MAGRLAASQALALAAFSFSRVSCSAVQPEHLRLGLNTRVHFYSRCQDESRSGSAVARILVQFARESAIVESQHVSLS